MSSDYSALWPFTSKTVALLVQTYLLPRTKVLGCAIDSHAYSAVNRGRLLCSEGMTGAAAARGQALLLSYRAYTTESRKPGLPGGDYRDLPYGETIEPALQRPAIRALCQPPSCRCCPL
jgi:hypothetical protein